MIFFVANDGTIIKGMPSPVYQGAANANTIYLIAPFATNTAVTVAFKLPNGVWTEPAAMTAQNALQGIVNEVTGQTYAGWTYDIPNNITEYYGTVTAQFFFYSAQAGVITATSATSFQVAKGVPAVLPDTPSQDIYEQILSNLAALQTQLNNGTFAARSIYAWNSTYTYGANEITFYPNIGEFGAFVQSVQTGNTGKAPYVNGTLNSQWWKEVVNFNTITEDFFNDIKEAQQAAEAAQAAAETAQEAAETAEGNAKASETAAQGYASAASGSAGDAASSAEQAADSATAAGQSASAAAGSATQAASSASAAAGSAQSAQESAGQAQEYMEQAKDYAKKEYKVYESFNDLPIPGDSAFIYLVPSSSGSDDDSYSEYLWISEDNKYEFIGTVNDVDLSNYAQVNGTYPNMTVGNATNATNAANAESATKAAQDSEGNGIAATYAKQNGTYPNMVVGKAELSNNNLLYNGDFRLNTQGQTSYPSGEPYGTDECADGWIIVEASNRTGTVNIVDGGIQINATARGFGIRQTVENTFAGKTVTLSFNVSATNGNSTALRVYLRPSDYSTSYGYKDVTETGTYTITATISESATADLLVYIAVEGAPVTWTENCSYTLAWVKLEEGETSTAPNGIVQDSTRALYAKKATEADKAAIANDLPYYVFGGTAGTYADTYFELCNIPSVTSGKASIVILLNGYRIDDLQRTGIVEIDVRASNGAWTYKQVKVLAGNLKYDRLHIYEDESKTVHVYLHVQNEQFKMSLLSVLKDDGVTVNYTLTYGALPSGASYGECYSYAGYDADGNDIAATYAKQNGIYADMTVGNATNATNATKATQDGDGNVIADTYATKEEISNPNLLINPDFRINQRGNESYIISNTYQYTVDRWKAYSSNGTGATVTPPTDTQRLRLQSGTGGMTFRQDFEEDLENSTTYSLSFMYNNIYHAYTFTTPSAKPVTNTSIFSEFVDSIFTISCYFDTSNAHYAISINMSPNQDIQFQWIKLEKGPVATIFVPPDTAIELLKCQRYFQKLRIHGNAAVATTTGVLSSAVKLITSMRDVPELKITTYPDIRGYGISGASTGITIDSAYDNLVELSIGKTQLTVNQVYVAVNGEIELDSEL